MAMKSASACKKCGKCDGIECKKDLARLTPASLDALAEYFVEQAEALRAYSLCRRRAIKSQREYTFKPGCA